MKVIRYREGYAYQLAESYRTNVSPIVPLQAIDTDFVKLDLLGNLTISKGYAWNGADVIPDTPKVMRGSLLHDALYQLMRCGYLDPAVYRREADKLLRTACIEDGVLHAYAQAIYEAVRLGGGPAADPANERPVLEAPREEPKVEDVPAP